MNDLTSITEAVKRAAAEAGVAGAGIAPVRDFPELALFEKWLAAGLAGNMEYLARRTDEGTLKRASLETVFPWARSAIVCAMNYNSRSPLPVPRSPLRARRVTCSESELRAAEAGTDVLRGMGNGQRATISQYAWTQRDYHDVVMAALRRVEQRLRDLAGNDIETRCYVDTGPLVERVVARYAGIGWIGKNTCIINQRAGSWLFLGVILTSVPCGASASFASSAVEGSEPETGFVADMPAADRCGTCTRCLDACPTDAFVGPHQLDSRRCISYLTIEKRGTIQEELRGQMGRHVFGCDICQDVCPWNRRAPVTSVLEFQPRKKLVEPPLAWLATISEEDFRETFRGSPIKRAKRSGLRRNAVIAMGNSGDATFLPLLRELADDADEIVAGHARWAMERLTSHRANGSSGQVNDGLE